MRKLTPFPCHLILAALVLPAWTVCETAQVIETKPAASNKQPAVAGAGSALADRILKARRAQAESLLLSLAGDAANFKDSRLRARSLARIADSLWDVGPEQARAIFRKAWEAAAIGDREGINKLQQGMQRQQATPGTNVVLEYPPDLRNEVRQLASQHDPVLGEEFLQAQKTGSDNEPAQPGSARFLVETLPARIEAAKSAEESSPSSDLESTSTVESEIPTAKLEPALRDSLEHAGTSSERDALYVQLALLNLDRGDWQAREWAGQIDESDLRKRTQVYVDGALAIVAFDNSQIDKALELVREGELNHVQKAWVLTQCAMFFRADDRERALSLLDNASAEARRIEVSDVGHPRVLFGIANAFRLIDPARAWDAAFEAVKSANSAEGFTGEDGELTLKFEEKGQAAAYSNHVPDFDIAELFGKFAQDDFNRTVQLARGFQGEAPRANATIAIARAALGRKPVSSEKKAGKSTQ